MEEHGGCYIKSKVHNQISIYFVSVRSSIRFAIFAVVRVQHFEKTGDVHCSGDRIDIRTAECIFIQVEFVVVLDND